MKLERINVLKVTDDNKDVQEFRKEDIVKVTIGSGLDSKVIIGRLSNIEFCEFKLDCSKLNRSNEVYLNYTESIITKIEKVDREEPYIE